MSRILFVAGGVVAAAAAAYWWFNRDDYVEQDGDPADGATFGYDPPASADPDAEVLALARTMSSEAGSNKYSDDERLAIGATTRNHYYRHGLTIDSGQGAAHAQAGGHYASSAQPPTDSTIALARQVLAPGYVDPTAGALNFFEPAEQDVLYALQKAGVTRTAQGIRDKWSGEGLILYVTVGAWEFWGPSGPTIYKTQTGNA